VRWRLSLKFWKRNNDSRAAKPILPKDLAILVRELEDYQRLLNFLGSQRIDEFDKERLRKLEDRVIGAIPDSFHREVVILIQKHGFDITEFAGEDWKDKIRSTFEDIASYLSPNHPLNVVGNRLPVEGREYLFWMLERAKNAPDPDERYQTIANTIKMGEIADYRFDAEQILDSLISMALVVWFSRDYGRYFTILMELMCDVPGGEEFLQKEILEKVL